jgi:hypothetical protein
VAHGRASNGRRIGDHERDFGSNRGISQMRELILTMAAACDRRSFSRIEIRRS